MDSWSRVLAVILGGQSEEGTRSYVFVLPAEEQSRTTRGRASLEGGRLGTGMWRAIPDHPGGLTWGDEGLCCSSGEDRASGVLGWSWAEV